MDEVKLELRDDSRQAKAEEIQRPFHLDEGVAKKITEVFEKEMLSGLESGLKDSSLLMENTFVPELMKGTEEGHFLALDLGGTNFRVMLLELKAGKITREEVSYYSVAESTRLGEGEKLFDFLAECIYDFVEKQGIIEECLPLGFTFSFPMEQNALDSGILVTWTKSFNCAGVVGTDAAEQLNKAIERHGKLKVRVVAILNDTTGTLVKGSYDDPRTAIGLILGTGCNGAYLEKAEKVTRWGKGNRYSCSEVIVDPEFGAFGDNGCLDFVKTLVDKEVDQASLLPGSFTYEKYFAGKYIGEVVRRMLVFLHSAGAFCPGQANDALVTTNAFSSEDLSSVEADRGVREIAKEKLGLELDSDDERIIKAACSIVTHRGAFLVAVVLAALLRRMSRPGVSAIAVTGSLYKLHPNFKAHLEKYIEKYAEGNEFTTFLSDDGSGKGAGLVAAIADRISSKK